MIKSFKHKGLKALYENDDARGVKQDQVKRLRALLARLDASNTPTDMDFPGLRLHPLHGDFAGFSRQDQILLSAIVKSHRRKFSRSLFNELPSPWNVDAPILTVILRLSVLLHRNRQEHELPDFKISLIKTKIRLQFPEYWLAQAPLTHADLIQEADYLKSAGFKLEFA